MKVRITGYFTTKDGKQYATIEYPLVKFLRGLQIAFFVIAIVFAVGMNIFLLWKLFSSENWLNTAHQICAGISIAFLSCFMIMLLISDKVEERFDKELEKKKDE